MMLRKRVWSGLAVLLAVLLVAGDALSQRRGGASRGGASRGGASRGGGGARSFSRGGGSRSFSAGRSRSFGGSRSRSSVSPRSFSSGRRSYSAPRSSRSYSAPRSRSYSAPRSSSRAYGGSRSSRSYGSPSRSFGSSRSYGGSNRSYGGSSRSYGGGYNRGYGFGTNSGPRLHRGGTSSRGNSSARLGRSSSGRTFYSPPARGTTRSGTTRAGNTRGTTPRSSARSGAAGTDRGFVGFMGRTERQGSYKSASHYRNRLDSRLKGGGRDDARGGAGRATGSKGAGVAGGRGNVAPKHNLTPKNTVKPTGPKGNTPGGKGHVDPKGAKGNHPGNPPLTHSSGSYGDYYGGDHHHHHHHGHHHYCDDHFYFHFGFGGFGFGYYRGWHHHGFYASFYYPYYCGYSYYYPYYASCWYPYYWSYSYYPFYRRHYYAPYRTTYIYYDDASSYHGYGGPVEGYWPGTLDDPYVEPEEAPAFEEEGGEAGPEKKADVESSEKKLTAVDAEPAVLEEPLVETFAVAASADEALKTGARYMKLARYREAAEAYRQAWKMEPSTDTMLRLGVALFAAGDYPLASWAVTRGVGASEKHLLDLAVILDDSLGGAKTSKGIRGLERYLVDNPNDEASNLLLGATYVLTGRAYAGRLILDRVRAAGFEAPTAGVFIDHAESTLKK